ncbi:hypothetical protein [Desulfosarcina variabilis]|uniref:hypothetical protein n=1 Tax=Desulfosarcina variabilis TaxID=2300 RepID=UPI003AFB0CDA
MCATINFLTYPLAGKPFAEILPCTQGGGATVILPGLRPLKSQGYIKEFFINQDPNAVSEYKKLYDTMYGVLETAEKHLVGNRERTEVVHTFMKNLRDYDEAFTKIQQHITESSALLANNLSAEGTQMEADLTQIMQSAKEEGNLEVPYVAG